jgi:O-antigen biosynthesis protein WbqP
MGMTNYERIIKPSIDRAVAVTGLAVLSPILLVIAAAIWASDGRPALFRQERVGAGGSHFTVYKFRTFSVDAPHVASHEAGGLQPFPVGRMLRRLSLDELPQLMNVAKAQMSLVGPRPPLPTQHDVVAGRRACGALRLRPGMTGLAQIRSYDGMPPAEKVKLDCEYARTVSWRRDLAVALGTIRYMLRPPPTY